METAFGEVDDGNSTVNIKFEIKRGYEYDSDESQLVSEEEDGAKAEPVKSPIKEELLFCDENNPMITIQLLPVEGSHKQNQKSCSVDPIQMTVLKPIAPRPIADSETQVNLQSLSLVMSAGIPFQNPYHLPPGSVLTVYTPRPENVPKNRRNRQADDGRPYIKKPPNAFLLFMKDQRPTVVADLKITDNALVNVELGQRWNSLLQSEKDKYIQEAEQLKILHEKQYPEWSSKINYGKKKKRIRTRRSTMDRQ
ncbi:transcription factor 7-like [Cynoglossus semilaevis]|uniref:transcription factor 7-like n=1 Tax=Cynoglossus semilaevis TaxID=244447 RepID=UPI000496B3FB|nr:transcription factor 7-like [Cynoglossus semilaevis]